MKRKGDDTGPIVHTKQILCPHCGSNATFTTSELQGEGGQVTLRADYDEGFTYQVYVARCPNPECRECVVDYVEWDPLVNVHQWERLHPMLESAPKLDDLIRSEYRVQVGKAYKIRSVAPEAAAILLRRCLEELLTEFGYKGNNLSLLVEAAAKDPKVPGYLIHHFDLLRTIGNWGAHGGELLHVEPGEVDQLLDSIVEALDFYFVKPEKLRKAQARTNERLALADKKLLPERAANDSEP